MYSCSYWASSQPKVKLISVFECEHGSEMSFLKKFLKGFITLTIDNVSTMEALTIGPKAIYNVCAGSSLKKPLGIKGPMGFLCDDRAVLYLDCGGRYRNLYVW